MDMKNMKKITSGFILIFEIMMVLLVIFIAIFVSAGNSFSIANLIDMPSFVLLLLFTVPILFVSGMAADFAKVFSIGKGTCSLAQLKKTLEAIKMLQRLVLCGAGLMALLEFIIILHMLDEPALIGPNMAVAVLVALYGLMIEALLIPLSAYVQNHITDAMNTEEDTELTAIDVVDKNEEA